MKKINIVRCFFTLCILALTIMLVVQISGMNQRYTSTSARLSSSVTKKSLCEDLEKEKENNACKITSVTAFSQQETVIEGKELGRKQLLNAYCIYGEVEKVLPVSLIAGNLLIREDTYGCILTKKSAYSLFGSIDVVGLEIIMNQKTYTIRGVIEANIEAVFYESTADTDSFDCLEFQIDDENGEFYANQFVQIYGLSADYIIGENYLVKVLKNLCLFPFLIIIMFVVIWFIQKSVKFSQKKLAQYMILGIGIMSILVVFKLLGYFPERWIPSKWSNFEHYSGIFQDIKAQLQLLLFAKPIAKEVALKTDLTKAVCLFIASIVGQIYVIRNLELWGSRLIDKYSDIIKLR